MCGRCARSSTSVPHRLPTRSRRYESSLLLTKKLSALTKFLVDAVAQIFRNAACIWLCFSANLDNFRIDGFLILSVLVFFKKKLIMRAEIFRYGSGDRIPGKGRTAREGHFCCSIDTGKEIHRLVACVKFCSSTMLWRFFTMIFYFRKCIFVRHVQNQNVTRLV